MAFIPGLIASFLPDLISGAEDVVKTVVGDAAHGKIHSGSDFGQSLLGGLGKAIGVPDEPAPAPVPKPVPIHTQNTTAAPLMQQSTEPMRVPSIVYPGSSDNLMRPNSGLIAHNGEMAKLKHLDDFKRRGIMKGDPTYSYAKDHNNRLADYYQKHSTLQQVDHAQIEDRERRKQDKYEREYKRKKAKRIHKKANRPVHAGDKLPKVKTNDKIKVGKDGRYKKVKPYKDPNQPKKIKDTIELVQEI